MDINIHPSIKDICTIRFKDYIDILLKYDEHFTVDFFLETFFYQTVLIANLKENNTFMKFGVLPDTITEWLELTNDNRLYKNIHKTLSKKINMILDFINNSTPYNLD